jgi:hypothetical protein
MTSHVSSEAVDPSTIYTKQNCIGKFKGHIGKEKQIADRHCKVVAALAGCIKGKQMSPQVMSYH